MIPLDSSVENQTYRLEDLEDKLKPLGYVIGGNWDYDHGSFDYKMDDENGYYFLRVPFKAIDGQLDSDGCSVQLGQPFLLSHEYQEGLDDHADAGNFSASVNQFSEPKDRDGNIPETFIEKGEQLVEELEKELTIV